MTLQKLLETFDPLNAKPASEAELEALTPAGLDALRSRLFEEGYASGWEDAKSAEADSRQRIDAEFERNIQNLAFTYNEAVDRVRGELTNFVTTLIDGFIPEIVPEVLREHVRNELIKIADGALEVPIEIVAASDCTDLLTDMIGSDFSMDINLVADPNLASKQVFVRLATREIEIDLSPLLSALRDQLHAMRQTEGKVVNLGE